MKLADRILGDLRRICKNCLAKFLYHSGLTSLLFKATMMGNGKLLVLLYHRVNDEGDHYCPALPTLTFKNQVDFLKKNARVTRLESVVESLRSGRGFKNCVAITIDDSYVDAYKKIFPILRDRQLHATIFLNTGQIDTRTYPWGKLLAELIRTTKVQTITLCIDEMSRDYSLASEEDKLIAFREIKRVVKSMTASQRSEFLDRLTRDLESKVEYNGKAVNLTWGQARKMAPHVSFGAHTHSHTILSNLNENEIRAEIGSSKDLIENNLHTKVTMFAYPNGNQRDFHDSSKQVLRENGFSCALTTVEGVNKVGTDPYEIRRIYTSIDSIERFTLYLLKCFWKRW